MSELRQSEGVVVSRDSRDAPNFHACAEQDRDTRARVWRYIFDCYQTHKKGGVGSTADDAKEIKDEFRATARIPD